MFGKIVGSTRLLIILVLLLIASACGDSIVNSPQAVMPDGSTYQGELKNGLLHGLGKLNSVDGSVYEGEFKRGRYHGKGRLSQDDGSIYEGEFDNGVFSGKGRYSFEESWYEGTFEDGELIGDAQYIDYSGNKYKGKVIGWHANGVGELNSVDGSVLSGTFENGSLEGTGRKVNPDGSVYKGDFQFNEYHGKGVLTLSDKSVYDGEFSYGQYHGQGTLTIPSAETDDVEVLKGTWKRGKLVFNELSGEHQYDQAELALERHQLLLNTQLLNLKDSDRNSQNVYFLGVAGDGTQSVFRREIEYVRDIVKQRYGTEGRSISLVNHHDTAEIYPLATKRSISTAISAIAGKMNADNDVLFMYLSSHGSKGHEFSLGHDSIRLPNLPSNSLARMLRKTNIKWKVVFISACYSGGFIPDLEDETTLVITAADSENTSFGCSEESEMTYFGKAFFKEVLSKNIDLNLVDAFKDAIKIIEKWEEEEELSASNPSISAPKKILKKLQQLAQSQQH